MSKLFKFSIQCLFFMALPVIPLFAQPQKAATIQDSELSEPVVIALLTVIILLLAVIAVLGTALKAIPPKKRNPLSAKNTTLVLMLVLGLLSTFVSYGQEEAVAVVAGPKLIGGISATTFYVLFGIIVLEVIAILVLIGSLRSLVSGPILEKRPKEKRKFAWFEKLNNTKSLDAESEKAISLDHDYDGIGELDNPTPPWWQWSFILSVVFAVVYMYIYHIGKTAPLQLEELAIANQKAEIAKAAYMANSANNIDENNVELLTDDADIDAGKALYISNCAACHLEDGGGLIGPNLTDQYWLHGGSINDVFKVVKYGIPGTGMKSWENDFSPKQIAQIVSFIETGLQGTTPAQAKEPEGELYGPVATVGEIEEGEPSVN